MENPTSHLLIVLASIILLTGCGQYGEPTYPDGVYADHPDAE